LHRTANASLYNWTVNIYASNGEMLPMPASPPGIRAFAYRGFSAFPPGA